MAPTDSPKTTETPSGTSSKMAPPGGSRLAGRAIGCQGALRVTKGYGALLGARSANQMVMLMAPRSGGGGCRE